MRVDIITLFPELFESVFGFSMIKRAKEKGLLEVSFHNPRNYSNTRYKQIDDYPYGGESGMVMMIEPISKCIDELKEQRDYDEIIYLSPDGELLNQPVTNRLSTLKNIILLCGHYKGIDERIREHYITSEISCGDYVLSGGEYAAIVLTDAMSRLIPGVLSNETSALSDTFQDGLISPPVYTRPYDFKGWKVPDILLSGNQKKINQWKFDQALNRTKLRRPEMYKQFNEENQ